MFTVADFNYVIPTNEWEYQKYKKMKYQDYLLTDYWYTKRAAKFDQLHTWHTAFCQVCNQKDGLQVHHRTYENLGHEPLNDFTVLCKDCHSLFHANRRLNK